MYPKSQKILPTMMANIFLNSTVNKSKCLYTWNSIKYFSKLSLWSNICKTHSFWYFRVIHERLSKYMITMHEHIPKDPPYCSMGLERQIQVSNFFYREQKWRLLTLTELYLRYYQTSLMELCAIIIGGRFVCSKPTTKTLEKRLLTLFGKTIGKCLLTLFGKK